MSSVQVIKENSLGINRGLYGDTFYNSLTSSQITTLLAESAAVMVDTEAYNAKNEGKAWRYIGQESSMPKAQGTWRLLGSKNTRVVPVKSSRFVLPHPFIYGVAENMKQINDGFTNGSGLAHGGLIHKGVNYLAFAGQLVGVDRKGNAIMRKLTERDATAAYGTICYLMVDLPYELDAGDTVIESVMSFQTAHNDTGGGTTGATQFMSYNNKTRGTDKFYRSSSSSPSDIQAWKDWADSADVDTVPIGAATGTLSNGVLSADLQVGWKSQGLIAWVPEDTVSAFCAGDSKNQGQDNGNTGNTDPDIDIYGANGEAGHIWENVNNVGMQTEKGGDINSLSKYRRGELSVFCTVGDFDYLENDLGVAGSAITKENTCVAAYTALFQGFKQYVQKQFDVWVCRTVSPNVTSSDFLTTLSGQAPQGATVRRRINGAIRRGIPGNDGYIEGHNGVTPSPDACIFAVLPQSRKINTGTLTLSLVAATTDDAGYLLGTASASIFNRDDNFLKGVLEGIATASASPPNNMKFLIEYISATAIKIWLRGTKDNPIPYPSSSPTNWINGTLPLVVTLSTNPLYIGADHNCDASGTTYIHLAPEGEEANSRLNRQLGLPRI
jgi:hypothetical protein